MTVINNEEILIKRSDILMPSARVNQLDQQTISQANKGYFQLDTLQNEDYLQNVAKCLQYGSLIELTNFFYLQKKYNQINVYIFVGNIPIRFASKNSGNNDILWENLCNFKNNITCIFNEQAMAMQFFDENILKNAGYNSHRFDYFNNHAVCDNFQTFYSNLQLDNAPTPVAHSLSINVAYNKYLSNYFKHPESFQQLNNYVNTNSQFILSSDFNPGVIAVSQVKTPMIDNIVSELFTMLPWISTPNCNISISDNGNHIEVLETTDEFADLSSITFMIQQGNTNDAIYLIKNSGNVIPIGELKKFNDGRSPITSGDIVPYIANDSQKWSCLYWPDHKFIAESDGTIGTSFADKIYLFRQ